MCRLCINVKVKYRYNESRKIIKQSDRCFSYAICSAIKSLHYKYRKGLCSLHKPGTKSITTLKPTYINQVVVTRL